MVEDSGLSERELEIIKLVATGASNKEIANQLVISPNTVKVHLRNIFAKIEVVSRTEATLYAIKNGLINSEAPSPGLIGTGSEAVTDGPLPSVKKPTWRTWILPAVLIAALSPFIFMWLTPTPGGNFQPTDSNPENRWTTFADLPIEGYGMAETVYEGKAYLIGGSQEGTVSGKVWVYDAVTDQWDTRAEKPTPVQSAEAALVGEKIYVPGGLNAAGNALNILEIYDPRSDSWESGASIPSDMGGYALTTYEGRLFLFGGWNGKEFSSSVYAYDPIGDVWTVLPEMKEARAWACAAVIGSKIYLVGGENEEGVLSDTLAFYPDRLEDVDTSWEARADLPSGRKMAALTSLAGSLYLAGGVDANNNVSLPFLKYDEINNRWEELDESGNAAGEQLSVIALDTRIHLFGGSFQGNGQTSHTAFQAIYTVLIPAISR